MQELHKKYYFRENMRRHLITYGKVTVDGVIASRDSGHRVSSAVTTQRKPCNTAATWDDQNKYWLYYHMEV